VGESLAVIVIPISAVQVLRADEILTVRSFARASEAIASLRVIQQIQFKENKFGKPYKAIACQ
jgi:hypothetical protein